MPTDRQDSSCMYFRPKLHLANRLQHLSEGLEDAAFALSTPELGKPGRMAAGERPLLSDPRCQ